MYSQLSVINCCFDPHSHFKAVKEKHISSIKCEYCTQTSDIDS